MVVLGLFVQDLSHRSKVPEGYSGGMWALEHLINLVQLNPNLFSLLVVVVLLAAQQCTNGGLLGRGSCGL